MSRKRGRERRPSNRGHACRRATIGSTEPTNTQTPRATRSSNP